DWRAPFTDAARNVDADGIPFVLPPIGALRFEDLPVHEGARLTFEYGFDGVNGDGYAGVGVDFVVVGTPAPEADRIEAERELFRMRRAATEMPTRDAA